MQKLGLVGLLVLAAVFENKTTTLTPKETKVEQPIEQQIEQPTQNQVEEPKEALDLAVIKQPYLDEIENLKAQLVTLQELNRELSKEVELSKLSVVKVDEPREDTREQSAIESAKSVQVPTQRTTYGTYYYPASSCSNGSCSTAYGRRGLFGGFLRGR